MSKALNLSLNNKQVSRPLKRLSQLKLFERIKSLTSTMVNGRFTKGSCSTQNPHDSHGAFRTELRTLASIRDFERELVRLIKSERMFLNKKS